MEEQVVLVDREDTPLGTIGKMEAHKLGLLHRAFSVFIFNSAGELLLQQRAHDKYHSAGKWTNTCCSHPRPFENTHIAANRRLKEEMGLTCTLNYGFNFVYKAVFANELTEYEYDHVFFGTTDALPVLNPNEVASCKYMKLDELEEDLQINPHLYTAWLKVCFNKVVEFRDRYYG
jgi:isopentenyl-diphosphate delta-isomerase